MVNTLALICHEIDSAYWQEWKLFHLAGGESGFLLMHIPLLVPVIYVLVLVDRGVISGLILSLILCGAGIFAFLMHIYLIRREHPEFKTPVSQGILWTTILLSLVQLSVTLALLV
jgi:hypothetical protein